MELNPDHIPYLVGALSAILGAAATAIRPVCDLIRDLRYPNSLVNAVKKAKTKDEKATLLKLYQINKLQIPDRTKASKDSGTEDDSRRILGALRTKLEQKSRK
jgi:hypothetical protein